MGVDIGHLWAQAGPFAKGVVVVLALMSLFSLTVALTKFIQISKSNSATRKFAPQFSRAIQEEQLEQAITLAEKNKASHVAAVLGGALSEVKPLIRDRATITSADINMNRRFRRTSKPINPKPNRIPASISAWTVMAWSIVMDS